MTSRVIPSVIFNRRSIFTAIILGKVKNIFILIRI